MTEAKRKVGRPKGPEQQKICIKIDKEMVDWLRKYGIRPTIIRLIEEAMLKEE